MKKEIKIERARQAGKMFNAINEMVQNPSMKTNLVDGIITQKQKIEIIRKLVNGKEYMATGSIHRGEYVFLQFNLPVGMKFLRAFYFIIKMSFRELWN